MRSASRVICSKRPPPPIASHLPAKEDYGEGFTDYRAAHFWARQPVNLDAIVITGPQGKWTKLPADDREFEEKRFG
jgi:hypothetical protein